MYHLVIMPTRMQVEIEYPSIKSISECVWSYSIGTRNFLERYKHFHCGIETVLKPIVCDKLVSNIYTNISFIVVGLEIICVPSCLDLLSIEIIEKL